jgi:Cu-Zn family superoxide dismutase
MVEIGPRTTKILAGFALAIIFYIVFRARKIEEGIVDMPSSASAVAVFQGPAVRGEVVALPASRGCKLQVKITGLPAGKHGFHIHTAGDLRGEGCQGACQHFHKGRAARHGGPPLYGSGLKEGPRHTGDLGNIFLGEGGEPFEHTYILTDVKPEELWGRTLIVHADPDDLGQGDHEDSGTTGHSGARIGCAIFGRGADCPVAAAAAKAKTRKRR